MEEQLIETWNIHDRIHRYLLRAIQNDALGVRRQEKGIPPSRRPLDRKTSYGPWERGER